MSHRIGIEENSITVRCRNRQLADRFLHSGLPLCDPTAQPHPTSVTKVEDLLTRCITVQQL
jgi:hypothetical protein